MKNIAVFASGRGSNAKAIYEAMAEGKINGRIVCIICDKPNAPILSLAAEWGIPAHLIEPKDFPTRDIYEERLLDVLAPYKIDGIALAGFMRKLGASFVRSYAGKIINIHPSLLPKFRGLHAQRQALEAGESETGCTLHFVDEGLDTGPIICQDRIPILAGDTEESVSARLLPKEHATYVKGLALFCDDAIQIPYETLLARSDAKVMAVPLNRRRDMEKAHAEDMDKNEAVAVNPNREQE